MVSGVGAFVGGISACFSTWVFCLLQVIPFFMAFVIGFSATMPNTESHNGKATYPLLLSLMVFLGFTFIFVFLGLPTTGISKAIFSYREVANQFGGVLTGLLGLYLLGVLSLNLKPGLLKKGSIVASIFFGIALALAYKPCVTPTLTAIYGISQIEETKVLGGFLLFSYSLGVFTVISAFAVLLSMLSGRIESEKLSGLVAKVCGIFLIVFSVLVLTGNMTIYKSFLVGGFVDHESGEHQLHNHMEGH